MLDVEKVARFKDGQLSRAEAPKWLADILTSDGDYREALSKAGASTEDPYGEDGDTIHIFRMPDSGHLVIFWDTGEVICYVLIDSPADFLTFKAQYVAPLAQLIMQTDKFQEWDEERRKKNR